MQIHMHIEHSVCVGRIIRHSHNSDTLLEQKTGHKNDIVPLGLQSKPRSAIKFSIISTLLHLKSHSNALEAKTSANRVGMPLQIRHRCD